MKSALEHKPKVDFAALLASTLLAIQAGAMVLWWWGLFQPPPVIVGTTAAVNASGAIAAGRRAWVTRTRRWTWLSFLFAAVATAVGAWWAGHPAVAIAALGIACMTGGCGLGVATLRAALSPGVAALGVARTVINEAVHLKRAMVFVVLLVFLVSALPFALDPNELLKYRAQFFLTWALWGVGGLLSLMTLLVACWTICNELHDKQALLTLTKPISRGQYFLGKWLGLVLLDALLLAVAGTGVYAFAHVLRQQPARDAADRTAVDQEVFTARLAVQAQPVTPGQLTHRFQQRLKQLQTEAPDRYRQPLTPADRQAIEQAVIAKWYTIAPLADERYLFTGLQHARHTAPAVQLRFKPRSSNPPPDGFVRLALWLNDRPFGQIKVADNVYHVIDLPSAAIDDAGRLELRLANLPSLEDQAAPPSSVSFTPGEGLEVLYPVGRFGPNLTRGLIMLWIRLAFLAMLGLAAGAMLDFQVACLLSLLIYATAAASGFIYESLQSYVTLPNAGSPATLWDKLLLLPSRFVSQLLSGEPWIALKILIQAIGQGFMALVPALSEHNPVPLLADGRAVAWSAVATAAVKIGLLWSTACALVGWLAFRGRELAHVTI